MQRVCIVKRGHFHRVMLSTTTARGLEQADAGHTQFFYTGHVLRTNNSQFSSLLRFSQQLCEKIIQNLSLKFYVLIYVKNYFIFSRKTEKIPKFMNMYVASL